MSTLKLNGHPVGGRAALQASGGGQKQIWAAIIVGGDSPSHRWARQAVLANSFEVVLEGEAEDPIAEINFGFRAQGQLVNGRVGKDIKADFKSTGFVVVDMNGRRKTFR